MKKDLIAAITHLIKAKTLLTRHFSRLHWPCFYEDLDYLIQSIRDIQADLTAGKPLPP